MATRVHDNTQWVFLMLVGVACVGGLLLGALTIACLRTHARQLASGKLGLGPEAGNVTHYEYQVGTSIQNMCCVIFPQYESSKTCISNKNIGHMEFDLFALYTSQLCC